MTRVVRYVLYVVCAVEFIMAIAFFVQAPFVIDIWPFSGTTPLTFIFVASIFAAAAAATLWAVASGNLGALAGIGLDYFVILGPLAIFGFQLAASSGSAAFNVSGIVWLVDALLGLGLLLWSVRIPMNNTPPVPRLVRWSFVFFVIALVIVGGRLLLKEPNVIPWTITPELSVVIGWIFVGAAAYFVYGLLRPSWTNAAGQLAGFLAYDLVLIIPFITRLPTVAPEFRVGLILYTVVVTYSGLLATYYLFIHKPTRLWTRMPPSHQTSL